MGRASQGAETVKELKQMSETESSTDNASNPSEPGASTPEAPFDRKDLAQFEADDATAGKAIGKMLSGFFLYTVLAMGIVAAVTYWWFVKPNEAAPNEAANGKNGEAAVEAESH